MTTVFIDRDVPFSRFKRELDEVTLRARTWIRAFRVKGHYSFSYRRSSGGHVHWRVQGPEMSEYDAFLLRAHLGDDWKRTVLDMKRRAVNNAQVDRAWDLRYTAGKLVKSGPWVEWFAVRT